MTSSRTDSRRVVVTGLGVISPIGISTETLWSSLEQRQSGIARSEELPWGVVAGEVSDFQGKIGDFGDLEAGLKKTIRKALKLMNRETLMALASAQQALADSGLVVSEADPERIGVCFGTGNVGLMPQDFVAGVDACVSQDDVFQLERWGQHGIPQVEPLWLLKCLPNMPSCHIAICNGFRGPNNSITQRDAAANLAVAESCDLIADGEADVVITGGTGTMLVPMNLVHTVMEHTVASTSGDPTTVCRPFDSARSG
ncbi:MAG: beta-ketoacyl synthase N-terminal-like domain-containing protein, partial [Planctomycetaceae bacterium]